MVLFALAPVAALVVGLRLILGKWNLWFTIRGALSLLLSLRWNNRPPRHLDRDSQ
ncbi:hypothetical protein GCM10011374_37460 [Kocuria dechangensis]|uniref:Uncharacterized protein n=2 Tax=Kocuria dechangensis TaxID=1176249 RepID=A0A917H739_9MICC|nr:hypothetical protein GCM10011374_37460 [Kocuria dechangensis]